MKTICNVEKIKQKYSFITKNIFQINKRHETPVLNHPIKIIYVDNDLVVLDKPCSLPVSKNQKADQRNVLKEFEIAIYFFNFKVFFPFIFPAMKQNYFLTKKNPPAEEKGSENFCDILCLL